MEGFFNSLLDGSDNTFTAAFRAMRSVPINIKNTIFLVHTFKTSVWESGMEEILLRGRQSVAAIMVHFILGLFSYFIHQ